MPKEKKQKKYDFKLGDKVFYILDDDIECGIIEVIFKDTWGDTIVGTSTPTENILIKHNGFFIEKRYLKQADKVFKTKELLINSLKKQQIYE